MLHIDGCDYEGCEDVADAHLVIPGHVPHDAFLCAIHGPYLERSLAGPDMRLEITRATRDGRLRVSIARRQPPAPAAVVDGHPDTLERRRRSDQPRPQRTPHTVA